MNFFYQWFGIISLSSCLNSYWHIVRKGRPKALDLQGHYERYFCTWKTIHERYQLFKQLSYCLWTSPLKLPLKSFSTKHPRCHLTQCELPDAWQVRAAFCWSLLGHLPFVWGSPSSFSPCWQRPPSDWSAGRSHFRSHRPPQRRLSSSELSCLGRTSRNSFSACPDLGTNAPPVKRGQSLVFRFTRCICPKSLPSGSRFTRIEKPWKNCFRRFNHPYLKVAISTYYLGFSQNTA